MGSRLIFVYNADSGLFNTVADIAHKIFSPATYACRLCALSHDHFSVRKEWQEFIAGLGVSCEFLHRDELARRLPGLEIPLPAILREEAGQVSVSLSAEAINLCCDGKALQQAIRHACLAKPS